MLYVYTAGTSSQTQSWTDSQKGGLNTNPIVLDAAGRCDLYLDPTLAYRLVLTDSVGNVQFDVDNQYVAPADLGGSSLTPIYTTTDQSATGTKVFNGNVAIGQGVVGEYSSAPLQLVIGAAASTTSGVQFVNTTSSSINFGTAETGIASYKGAIGFNNTSGVLSLNIANAAILQVSSVGVGITGGLDVTSTINQAGVAVALSTDIIPLTRGGTGQTTANASLNALLPSQSGQSGHVLTTDGTNTSWADSTPILPVLTNGSATDRTITNSNVADPALSVILAASSTYVFIITAKFYSPSAGVFLGVGYTGTAAKSGWGGYYNNNGSGGFTQSFPVNTQTSIFTDGIDNDTQITIEGSITTTTTGTLSLNWGNAASGANNMTRFGGCGIVVNKVA